MTLLRLLVATVAAIVVLGLASPASAAVRRYAVVMGNNRGEADDAPLRYAENDAQRVYDVLKDLGGFEPADMVLLRGENAARAQATLIAVNERVRADIASGADALLFVFYSGHAGSDALHMADTRFDLGQLEQLVRGSAATFRILAVDACRSGALTRMKGGRPAPPFDIDVDERYQAYIKRVVALPGDTIEIRDDRVVINGTKLEYGAVLSAVPSVLEERNADTQYRIALATSDGPRSPSTLAAVTVPSGHCFLLGDNRRQSVDSRSIGPVPLTDIVGRVWRPW